MVIMQVDIRYWLVVIMLGAFLVPRVQFVR